MYEPSDWGSSKLDASVTHPFLPPNQSQAGAHLSTKRKYEEIESEDPLESGEISLKIKLVG